MRARVPATASGQGIHRSGAARRMRIARVPVATRSLARWLAAGAGIRVALHSESATSRFERIVCLANSRKPNGRCVAGKALEGRAAGQWIRPVSDRKDGEVSECERQHEDGSDPQVLDVIDVPLIQSRPVGHQSENWLLDARHYWKKAGRLAAIELRRCIDPVGPLWIDGHNTWNGSNDKVPTTLLAQVDTSLRLIHVAALTLAVFVPGETFGNPSVAYRVASSTRGGGMLSGLRTPTTRGITWHEAMANTRSAVAASPSAWENPTATPATS